MRGYEGNLIKAEMQKVLRTRPMTPSEIGLHFKLDRATVSNFLTTLKGYGLVSWHPDFCTGHVIHRKYHAHHDGEDFMELITKAYKTKQERIAEKRKAKEQEAKQLKLNPHVRIFTMEHEIFREKSKLTPRPKHKHEWTGYNSMAGL